MAGIYLHFAECCRDCAICADGRLSWIYADAFDRGSASGFCDLLCDCKRTTSGNAYEAGEKTPRYLQKYGAAGMAAKTQMCNMWTDRNRFSAAWVSLLLKMRRKLWILFGPFIYSWAREAFLSEIQWTKGKGCKRCIKIF